MGVVYKARDLKLERFVAVKFLPPHLSKDDVARKRFIREAKASSALDHANIGTIHEIDETPDGQTFIAMTYYEGETLRERIDRGGVSVEESLAITSQIASGLARAHEKGIVHRDIKPSNIIVTKHGEVKIVDFGLAKLAGKTRLTEVGSTIGTITYMSPEQASGAEVDERSDVFSLGAVLYELLAGEPPFKGEHKAAVLYEIVHEEPEPVSACRSGIPVELDRVASKLLAKNVEDRYQSTGEVFSDLTRVMETIVPGSARRLRLPAISAAKRKTVMPIVLLAASVVLVLVLVFTFFRPGEGIDFSERDWLLVTDIENLTGDDVFDNPLNEAIAIDIQQSRWVNVFDRARMNETLKRMEREHVNRIDESLGMEICKREGINAMLVPKISSVGETYNLSAVIVDVNSGNRLSPIRVTVTGRDEILASAIDQLTEKIRENLGESLESIEKTDKSLPKVTTSSLAALEQFFLGTEMHKRPENWNEVKIFYENAIALDSTFAYAYASLGTVCANIRDLECAKHNYTKAVQYIDNLTARERYRILAEYDNIVEEDPEKAIQSYKALLEMYPDYSSGHNNLGYIYQRLRRYDEALASYEEAIRIDPYFIMPRNNISDMYLDSGEYDKVIEVGSEIVRIDSTYAMGYLSLGRAYNSNGNYNEALGCLRKAVMLDPDNAWIHLHIGRSYQGKEMYDEAIEEFRRSCDLDPRNHFALSNIACAYAHKGMREEAIRIAEEALDLGPREKKLYNLACVYSLLNEREKAIECLTRSIEEGYRNYDHIMNDSDIETIRDDPRFAELMERIRPE